MKKSPPEIWLSSKPPFQNVDFGRGFWRQLAIDLAAILMGVVLAIAFGVSLAASIFVLFFLEF